MHRKKILLVLGLSISLSLATPSVVFAKDIPAGQTEHISSENIETNNGTVELNNDDITIETNNGSVQTNAGTVETNNGSITTNTNTGTVETNANGGGITTNAGEVGVNNGTIGTNDGTVETNNGTITNNSGGTVETNNGNVGANNGTIEVNKGTVEANNGVVVENQGTVVNVMPTSHVEVNNGGTVNGSGKVEINLSHKENVAPTVNVVQQMWKLNYNNMNSLSITDCRDDDKANIYTMQDTNGKLQVWLWEDGSVIVKPLGNWDVMELSADNGAKVEKRSDGSFRISNVTRDTNLGFTLYNYTGSNDDSDNWVYSSYDDQLRKFEQDIRAASYTSVDANGNPIDIKIASGYTNFDWSGYMRQFDHEMYHTVFTGTISGASKGSFVEYDSSAVKNILYFYHRVCVVFRDPVTGETTYEYLGNSQVQLRSLSFHVPYENCEFAIVATPEAQEQTHNTVMGAEVGMVPLSAGNDFVGAATEGLALAANTGADGVSSFAQMGGGRMRQETG